MSTSITVDQAQSQLKELIAALGPGDEVVLTQDEKPVARLMGANIKPRPRRQLGTLRGSILFMSSDFDAPLEDFNEYME